jgi:AraC-like ligand binding domain
MAAGCRILFVAWSRSSSVRYFGLRITPSAIPAPVRARTLATTLWQRRLVVTLINGMPGKDFRASLPDCLAATRVSRGPVTAVTCIMTLATHTDAVRRNARFASPMGVAKRTHRVKQHRSTIPGIEAMSFYSNHSFPRHCHDQYGIGVMISGAQRSWSLLGQVESEAGDVIMVNPGEMHDGIPVGGAARGWRTLYMDPTLVARKIADEAMNGEFIVRPVARDSQLADQA